MTGRSPAPTTPAIVVGVGVLATAAGGALGALGRWSLSSAFPPADGHFPWTVFLINVVGSGLLAALPLLRVVRRRPWVPLFLGTGLLGGFTTMSAASVDTFTLLDQGHTGLALTYCLGTLGAAWLFVLGVEHVTSEAQRTDFESREGDE